jgi:hypothetical protein
MVELSYFALFLLFVACLAAGVTAAVVHTWALRAHTYSLENRLSVVEGTLTREVKARAGQERWKKPAQDDALVQQLLAAKATPPPKKLNWWETNLPREVSR